MNLLCSSCKTPYMIKIFPENKILYKFCICGNSSTESLITFKQTVAKLSVKKFLSSNEKSKYCIECNCYFSDETTHKEHNHIDITTAINIEKINEGIQRQKEVLNYYERKKNKIINELIMQINQIISGYEEKIMFQEEIIRYIEILKDIYDNNKFSYQAIYNLINNSHFIGDIKPIENTNDYITTLKTFQVIAGNRHSIFHNNNQRVIDINTNIPNLVIHYTKFGLYLGSSIDIDSPGTFITSKAKVCTGRWSISNTNTIKGYGTVQFANGEKYIGMLINLNIDGIGTYYYSNKERYTGEWKNNIKQGYGKYYYSNGAIFEGQWRDNIKEGYGRLYLKDGSRYEGMYHNNTLNGYGRYCGTIQFEGDFLNGISQGYGIQTDKEGVYMGEMHKGKREGMGKYLYNERKEIYEGEWKNDYKEGFGIEYYANGDRFGGV